ncbi:PREDICTED: vacuolar protein sorting-associated protein 54-like [Priapulus caudatus]|uniref:Vacuolar protein sorting-associated protein 54 n=1 Tax=Priapulus caudatus TaxID=37621 RepID=A0ABM1EAA5_PRICU|nr:PREDICTED: vacuolar protein sorting-associated protein 54-like [Priapulus caudatus]
MSLPTSADDIFARPSSPPDRGNQPVRNWRRCVICSEQSSFKSPREFATHLRELHSTREGGSFICRYGLHGVCPSLPVLGVSDKDYEDHVSRDHILTSGSRSGSSSRASTPGMPRSSTVPNIVSANRWSVYSSSQNLPAALNDPNKSRSEAMVFFTRTWGTVFIDRVDIAASPYLDDITRTDFEDYMQKTSVRYRRHQQYSQPANEKDKERDVVKILHNKTREAVELARSADLDQIPKVFMQPNFQLEDPDTFRDVLPWSQLESSSNGAAVETKARQSSRLLQEKLTHYLDIVEVQLAKMISLRSDAFFHAMTSHDQLQSNMLATCHSIKHLRDRVHTIDKVFVEGPLKIMKLKSKRTNYVTMYNKLKMMATVHQTQPTIQLLLSTSEFVGALDLISTTQEVLTQELAGIVSFRHLGSQLTEMEKLIDKMMQSDFVRYAVADLTRPLTPEQVQVMEEERLVTILFGMLQQRKFVFVDMYREEAAATIKAIIKQTVIEIVSQADDIDVEGNVSSLADQMRLLQFETWLELLREVFRILVVLLTRIQGVRDMMQDVVHISAGKARVHGSLNKSNNCDQWPAEGGATAAGITPEAAHVHVPMAAEVDVVITESECTKLTSSLRDMLCSLCDTAHDRCTKLLTAKAKDGFLEKLMPTEFVQLSRSIEQFATECERICGRRSTSLRGGLQSQANRFVNRFHEERKQKLGLILDNERWKQADVPAEFQELVDHMEETGEVSLPSRPDTAEIQKPVDYLFVRKERFAVVGTVLMLLKMVVEYGQCVDDMPAVGTDLLTRIVELLKLFNSRSCQLVLGAGALQQVRLKTITTKNLALASSCLQLMVHFMPLLRQHFKRQIPTRQQTVDKHFDQALKDYNDHIDEIANKLLAIMDTMIDSQLAKWEAKPPMPSSGMRAIGKQMGKLHEAIIDLLPAEQINALFLKINESFKLKFRQKLSKLCILNNGGPQHALVTSDLTFYVGQMKSLSSLRNFDDRMVEVWPSR